MGKRRAARAAEAGEVVSNETLLTEIMALRTIVINLAIAQARGELIDYADGERFRQERIGEAHRATKSS